MSASPCTCSPCPVGYACADSYAQGMVLGPMVARPAIVVRVQQHLRPPVFSFAVGVAHACLDGLLCCACLFVHSVWFGVLLCELCAHRGYSWLLWTPGGHSYSFLEPSR